VGFGCVLSVAGFCAMLGASLASVVFYLGGDILRAIFWLLVAVLLSRWQASMAKGLAELEKKL
jgi:hypothetical protein